MMMNVFLSLSMQTKNPVTVHFDAGCGTAVDLISGNMHDFGGGSELPPYSVQIIGKWKNKRQKPVDKMSTGWQRSRN